MSILFYIEWEKCNGLYGAEDMSIEPWNNGEGAPLCRESLLIYLHGISYFIRKGYHPFPAFRRGRVRAEPDNGSRDWSLAGP